MSSLLADVRFGVRMLTKRAGTSFLAVIALALGIGLTTTMFSIVNGAILRGLPFDESDRLIAIGRINLKTNNNEDAPLHDYVDWKRQQQSFEDLAAFRQETTNVSGGNGPAERYRGLRMTANTLKLLRVAPVAGRDLAEADCVPGAPAVALISYRVWQGRFDGKSDALGSTLRINNSPVTVVGVLPPKFAFPQTQDVWLPLQISLAPKRGDGGSVKVTGRLKPGRTEASALTEMQGLAGQLAQAFPENKDYTARVNPLIREFIGNGPITTLFAMLGAVFGVMLVACANVTNLQLARAMERAREVAIRTAMGAQRWRIVRQLLVEGLLLATCGAALGIGIASLGITLFNRAIANTNPPFWIDIRIDLPVLLLVIGLTATAALVSTIVPALRVSGRQAGNVLQDEGRSNTSVRAGVLSRVLVGFAVTLSCALLLVSGLMIKSVMAVGIVEYPFLSDTILEARLNLEEQIYPGVADTRRVAQRLEERLATLSGARRAAIATAEPATSSGNRYLTLEGQTFAADDQNQPTVRWSAINSRFFETFGVKAVKGRLFTAADRAETLPVTIVSEDFAAKYFPRGDAIGQRVRLGRRPEWPWWTIVGIVPQLDASGSPSLPLETAYVPLDQSPSAERGLTLFVDASGPPAAVTLPLRHAVAEIDPDLPLFNIDPLSEILWRRNWPVRVFGSLFMTFGLSALLMASVGLYGVLAFSVRRRTPEIGVRMALGAGRREVLRMILRQGMMLVGIGLVLGLVIGYFFGPAMRALLGNISPRDPVVYVTTILALSVTGFIASLVPAWRAASVDPLRALRDN